MESMPTVTCCELAALRKVDPMTLLGHGRPWDGSFRA